MDTHSLGSYSPLVSNFVIDIRSEGKLFQVRGKLIKEDKTQDMKGVLGKINRSFSKGIKESSETHAIAKNEKEILKIGNQLFEISKTALQDGKVVQLKLGTLEHAEYTVSNTSYETFKKEKQIAKETEKQEKVPQPKTVPSNANNNANVRPSRHERIVRQATTRKIQTYHIGSQTESQPTPDTDNDTVGNVPGVDYDPLTEEKLKRIEKYLSHGVIENEPLPPLTSIPDDPSDDAHSSDDDDSYNEKPYID